MKRTARTAALVIVPLASAVSAHAGAILPTDNFDCITNGSASGAFADCSSQAGVFQLNPATGITGVSFFTSGSVFIAASGSGSGDVEMFAGTSTFNGPLTQDVPFAVEFNATALSGGTITDWVFAIALGIEPEDDTYGFFITSGSGASASVSGSVAIPSGGVASGGPFYETWAIDVDYTNVVGGIQIDVPEASSVDFLSADASAVPEPGTLGLIGAGLALLGGLFRRRKKA